MIGTAALVTTIMLTYAEIPNTNLDKTTPYIYIQSESTRYVSNTVIQIGPNSNKYTSKKIRLHITTVSNYVPGYYFMDIDYKEL